MNLIDLQKSLRAVEPAAVLVPPRVLEYIVKRSWNLSGFSWSVPHRTNFVIDRQTFQKTLEETGAEEELVLASNEVPPATVILLASPGNDDIANQPAAAVLLRYWQLLFHGSIHKRLENSWSEGKLTQTDLRRRIADIGQAQFEEIKNVLSKDQHLPPDAGEKMIYFEFAAHFLELYRFSRSLLDSTFPGLRDKEAVRRLLEADIEDDAENPELFRRTRPLGAADPVVQTEATSREAHEFYHKLLASSERADKAGNVVLAAIQRRRAARVAPPDMAATTMQRAQADMHNLAGRLKNALDLDDERTALWENELSTLLDKADQGSRPAEAAMLYDLQQVCLDNEQDIYALDLVEWGMSMGRRPIKRPLPSQRLVRLTRHLRSATERLTMARLSDQDRRHLAGLLQSALHVCETRLRERFRPVLVTAFEDVGLKPQNPAEKVAFNKVIEELLDRVSDFGFLTFSDLRDVLSRNQLKLPDLIAREHILGDPLLRLDRRLARLLDGVYRRSEFYLRWLESFTAASFGTHVGRILTLFVALPFGLAFLLIEAGNLVSNLIVRFFTPEVDMPPALQVAHMVGMLASPHMGAIQAAPQYALLSPESVEIMRRKLGTLEFGSPIYLVVFFALGFFNLGMLHSEKMRHRVWHCISTAFQWLRAYLYQTPMAVLRSSRFKGAENSWSVQLLYHYAFKPLVLFVLILLVLAVIRRIIDPYQRFDLNQPLRWWGWALIFVVSNFLVNSRPGQAFTSAMTYSTLQILEQIRAGLLPRLFFFVVTLFKESVHFVETMLFYVDEKLRMRTGDSQISMVIRSVLTAIWFPISYLTRFNLVVFIEPFLNPLKLPVCTIAYKFYLPVYAVIQTQYLSPYWQEGHYFTWAAASWVNFWFADVFGFVFWELKENWRLYRSNRGPDLAPVPVGHHGETLKGLLLPGFHSGTVPKLYTRLRAAERLAQDTGNWSGVRSCKADLKQVCESVRLFLIRDFVALLDQDPHWRRQGGLDHLVRVGLSPYSQGQGMSVGKVFLSTNQIRVELLHPRYEEEAVRLEFTIRSGWLLAGFSNVGWLKNLGDKQLRPLHNALVVLYKLAGVDLVREQLQAVLPPEAAAADLSPQGIYVRQEGKPVPPVIYDLVTPAENIAPRLLDGQPIEGWPTLTHRQVLFADVDVTWEECIKCWQPEVKDASGRKEVIYLAPDIEFMPRGRSLVPIIKNGNGEVHENGDSSSAAKGTETNGEIAN